MAQRGVEVCIALLFQDLGTRRGWVVSRTPRLHFTPRKNLVPIVQEVGWAPGPVWTGIKSRPPLGFDPRIVQLVVSRYTDWATWPTVRPVKFVSLVLATQVGKVERLCCLQNMLAGMHVTHCFVCSLLTQAARVARAQMLNVSNRHTLYEGDTIWNLELCFLLLDVTFLPTITYYVHCGQWKENFSFSVCISEPQV